MWFYGVSVIAIMFQVYEAYLLQIIMDFFLFQIVEPSITSPQKERRKKERKKGKRRKEMGGRGNLKS